MGSAQQGKSRYLKAPFFQLSPFHFKLSTFNFQLYSARKELNRPGTGLFDLDGTLTDPEEGITRSVAYALERFGIEVMDLHTLTPFIGPPLKDSFMRFYGFSDEEALRAVALYRERFSVTGIFENRPYEGMAALLRSLRAEGLRLAVASSKPEIYVKQILEHFDLAAPFAAVCGSELDGRRVKKAEVVACALETLGVAPSPAVVMVGDREHDVAGAKANGLRCVGALYGFGSREELCAAGADFLAESVEDLGRVLRGIPELWTQTEAAASNKEKKPHARSA